MMNRGIEKGDDHMNVANCLMLLSKVGESNKSDDGLTKFSPTGRLFACKTCNRKFSSFQALGGHRASHKKPKLDVKDWFKLPSSPAKPKTHECPICGLEFPIGQALGGHMRRHRGADTNTKSERLVTRALLPAVSIMKKSSSKRVFCLDLNLTPMENDLTLQLGKLASACI